MNSPQRHQARCSNSPLATLPLLFPPKGTSTGTAKRSTEATAKAIPSIETLLLRVRDEGVVDMANEEGGSHVPQCCAG